LLISITIIILLHPALNSWSNAETMFFSVFQVPWRSCFFIATCLTLEILLSSSGCLSKGMAFKRTHLSNGQPKNLSGREDDENLMKWFSIWNKLGNESSLYEINHHYMKCWVKFFF
jgi:hypothetical protein